MVWFGAQWANMSASYLEHLPWESLLPLPVSEVLPPPSGGVWAQGGVGPIQISPPKKGKDHREKKTL